MPLRVQISAVLIQGLVASLFGGWTYDSSHSTCFNLIHFYFFFLFLCYPFVVHVLYGFNTISSLFYSAIVGVVFAAVKGTAWKLRQIFQHCEHSTDECNVVETDDVATPAAEETGAARRVVSASEIELGNIVEESPTADDEDALAEGVEAAAAAPEQRHPATTAESYSMAQSALVEVHQANVGESETTLPTPPRLRRELFKDVAQNEAADAETDTVYSRRRRHNGVVEDQTDAYRRRRVLSVIENYSHSSADIYNGALNEHRTLTSAVSATGNVAMLESLAGRSLKTWHRLRSLPGKSSSSMDIFHELADTVPEVDDATEEDDDQHVMRSDSEDVQPRMNSAGDGESRQRRSVSDMMAPSVSPVPMQKSSTVDDAVETSIRFSNGQQQPSTSRRWSYAYHEEFDEDQPCTSSATATRDEQNRRATQKETLRRFLDEIVDTDDAAETLQVIYSAHEKPGTTTTAAESNDYDDIVQQLFGQHGDGDSTELLPARVPGNTHLPLTDADGLHIATSHDDTTEGAVHCFEDETGNIWTYRFGADGTAAQVICENAEAAAAGIVSSAADISDYGTRPPSPYPEVLSRQSSSSSSDDRHPASRLIDARPSAIMHVGAGMGAHRALSLPHGSVGLAMQRHRRRVPRRAQTQASRAARAVSMQTAAAPDTLSRSTLQMIMARTLAAASYRNDDQFDYGLRDARSQRRPPPMGRPMVPYPSNRQAHRLSSLFRMSEMPVASRSDARTKTKHGAWVPHYYKVAMVPNWAFNIFCSSADEPPGSARFMYKLHMDRLKLQHMLDENRSAISAVFDVFLAVAVAFLAAMVLSLGLCYDIAAVALCLAAATAHYSLLKSAQPDAASPIHGYNPAAAYSRPVYFCVSAIVIIALHKECCTTDQHYTWLCVHIRDAFLYMTLASPLLFTVGVLPQISTLGMHVLEQIDVYVFGGTASTSLPSAVFGVLRSCALVATLSTLCYVSMGGSPTGLFSAFCAATIALSYMASRCTSHVEMIWRALLAKFGNAATLADLECGDNTAGFDALVFSRLRHDVICCALFGLFYFGLHLSTLFSQFQPMVTVILGGVACLTGFLCHYMLPSLRKATPWKVFSKPLLRAEEFSKFDVDTQAKLMWYEQLYCLMCIAQRNILYPLFLIAALSAEVLSPSFPTLPSGLHAVITTVAVTKLARAAFCDVSQLYVPLFASLVLIHQHCYYLQLEQSNLLFTFYVLASLWPKVCELLLKLEFVFAYVAPWQITWGSEFHAFAQAVNIPHAGLVLFQVALSSLLSAPLSPFLGSTLFIMSYMRPIKFWERNYNTKRLDNSNTRLSVQMERHSANDEHNLNSIFYEHLTRSLQRSLAGDIALGRWALHVQQGDCFVMQSFALNCLVHIVEVGNGTVTFQVRGLEFKGTYCQQREVEAISEDLAERRGCCCCNVRPIPGLLSFNNMCNLRWLCWEVAIGKYILDGYSITDNSAATMLQVTELRRLLITLYVKCIIYYTITSKKLDEWLCLDAVKTMLATIMDSSTASGRYTDVDPVFAAQLDQDYDVTHSGISLLTFRNVFSAWMNHCLSYFESPPADRETVYAFCYAISLVARRLLAAASHHQSRVSSVETFLYGLHALFKGDFRITCERDEWVFSDMDLMRTVIAPAVRMSVKLHQDHFAATECTINCYGCWTLRLLRQRPAACQKFRQNYRVFQPAIIPECFTRLDDSYRKRGFA